MNRDPQQSFTYQLRIVLCDVSPLIWRRLLVQSNIDLARLSRILQILFSWSGEHCTVFIFTVRITERLMRVASVPAMIRVRSDSRIFPSTAVNASYINTISLPVGKMIFNRKHSALLWPKARPFSRTSRRLSSNDRRSTFSLRSVAVPFAGGRENSRVMESTKKPGVW